jgi:hypothetical protein
MRSNSDCYREYRNALGLRSQEYARSYLSGKDIVPDIDYDHIVDLMDRLSEILLKLNSILHPEVRHADFAEFRQNYIMKPYQSILKNSLTPRLNNQGRRPEQVLFSWIRGYAGGMLFLPAVARLLKLDPSGIQEIGDDNWHDVERFRRSPKADFSVEMGDRTLRIEMQTGFQGINDVKRHKIIESRSYLSSSGNHTLCTHFDIFNGQAAFLLLSRIKDADTNWVVRQQMEGQTVFQIDQSFFKWRFTDALPAIEELDLNLD